MRLWTLLTAALVLPGVAAQAQVDPALVDAAQAKVLAVRAAEADAYRKLAEAVKGVQINSDTYVRDFVTESDTISAAVDDFIRGVRLGKPRFYEDGSVEVPAEVTVEKVIEELRRIHEQYYKGNRIKGRDFEEIKRHVQRDVIRVVGSGAPRMDLPPGLPEGVQEQLGGPPIPPQPPVPDLWRAMGPQARLMARRAAEVDAKRKLIERIKGVRITSDTQVRDFVTESDVITARAMDMIRGATIVGEYYHADEPIVEVTVEVPTETVIETIRQLHTQSIRGDRIRGTDITDLSRQIKTKKFEATGMGVPPQRYLRNMAPPQGPDGGSQRGPMFPPWAMGPIRATGEGVPPADKAGTAQGRLLAARAAEMDAKRKLAEMVNGLQISSKTTVKDFVTEHDEIHAYLSGVLTGALVEKTEWDGETAQVTVSIPGMEVWGVLNDAMAQRGAPIQDPRGGN